MDEPCAAGEKDIFSSLAPKRPHFGPIWFNQWTGSDHIRSEEDSETLFAFYGTTGVAPCWSLMKTDQGSQTHIRFGLRPNLRPLVWIISSSITPTVLPLRPSTASTGWACSACPWSRPTPSPRPLWGASTCRRSSSCTWRGGCTPATSSCAPTPASPTCPSRGRNNRVSPSTSLHIGGGQHVC